MKKTLFAIIFIGILSLSGCSTSVPQETPVNTSEKPSNSQDSNSSTNDDVSDSDDLADKEAEMEKEAKEAAATATKITDGDVFDSISAIYEDITLYSMKDNTLHVDINSPYVLPSNAPKKFFKIAKEICQSCELENYYSSITFSLLINDEFTAFFICSNYQGTNNFSTSTPHIMDEEFETEMNEAYVTNAFFYSHDMDEQRKKDIEELGKKYGLD